MDKKKKRKKKKKTESNKTLIIVFILLLVLVIVLSVLCYKKDKESKKNVYANIVIPITETSQEEEFSINAKTLSSAGRYTFKIVNYKNDTINSDEIEYRIEVSNPTNSIITLKKKDTTNDLMKYQELTTISNQKLGNKKKENIYYYVEIGDYGELKNNDLITIKIIS